MSRSSLLSLLICLLAGSFLFSGKVAGAITVQVEGRFGPSDGSFDRGTYGDISGEVALWDSWQRSDANQGKLKIGPFQLEKYCTFYAAGAVGTHGIVLAWEDAATGKRCELAPRAAPDNRWVLLTWKTPEEWRGKSVYLVAEDNSSDPGRWVGISEPHERRFDLGSLVSVFSWHTVAFIAVLLPGAGWVAWRHRKRNTPPELRLAWVLVASSVAAYLLFFVYLASPLLGKIGAAVLLTGGIALFVRFRPARFRELAAHPLIAPLGLCYFAALFYSCVLLLYGGSNAPHLVSMNRYLYTMPPDTILPYWLSERLFSGYPTRPFFGDWLSSDRPPLQAAFHLLLGPLGSRRFTYQLVATVLQTWSFLGVWILLRRARLSSRITVWILFGCVFSGFFVFNGTFVWPKLLPAALLFIATIALFFRPFGSPVLAGAAAALAMLSHGGSIFGLAGIIAASLIWPPERKCVYWAKTVAVGVVLLVPWTLYQKLYDPPGNRLLKWHLAGVVPVDERPLGQTLMEAYRSKSMAELAEARLKNLEMTFYDFNALDENWRAARDLWSDGQRMDAFVRWIYQLREACFFHFIHSPELLILGAIGLPVILVGRRRLQQELRLATLLGVILLFSVGVWCLLMFYPGSTGNHQGSYYNNGCLFILLGLGLAHLPTAIRWSFAALYVVWLLVVWVYAAPYAMNTPALLSSEDPALTALAAAAMLGTFAGLAHIARSQPPSVELEDPANPADQRSLST